MPNKNIPHKSICSPPAMEESVRESQLEMQKSDKPIVLMEFEFEENYIMSRRPTRLSLKILSQTKKSDGVS